MRLWQEAAFNNLIANNLRGIVEVATAGGKTRFALECLVHYKSIVNNECIVIITPTTALADQWNFALIEDMGISETDICIWPESADLKKKVHILVINTARTKLPKIIEMHPEAFVIADEVHRFGSQENSKAFGSKFKYSLGLTATAEREFDEGLSEILIPAFGKIIYEYSLIDASKDEIISPFALINVEH